MNNYTTSYPSWGRYPQCSHAEVHKPQRPADVGNIFQIASRHILPRGMGRSYGDVCLNENAHLLLTTALDKLIAFNSKTGLLCCEAGITLDEILRVFVPRCWFPQVTPGTKFVTIGGAIANDVHGKNHHQVGNFGCHVVQFELLRSDGSRIWCSRTKNEDWFRASIGGLGLTGIILQVEFYLKRIEGPYLQVQYEKFCNFDEFFELSKRAEADFEYTVAWLDCMNTQFDFGRGIFMRANHSTYQGKNPTKNFDKDADSCMIPFEAPSFLLSKFTSKAFNYLYYHSQHKKVRMNEVHFSSFFYPLDSIKNWNRLYGKRGFLQWQCVLPDSEKDTTIKKIFKKIAASRMGSFLAVLKEFGKIPSQGMLSFPMPGLTLALDFPNSGERLFMFLDELDMIVCEAGGRIYPAKDARMSAETFRTSFSAVEQFEKYVDPKFSSSFYRRVMNRTAR